MLGPEILALLGKTINMMEGFAFLWVVLTGLELNLWQLLVTEKNVNDLIALSPDWDPVLLDHWLEQALCLDLVSKSGENYALTKLGRSIETFRYDGLEAMYKEFNLYWTPLFAQLPQIIARKIQKAPLDQNLENDLISRASLASEPFVWPFLKDKCITARWQRVLDIGCGEGRYLGKLLETYPNLQGTGIEMNPAVAARARETAQNFDGRMEIICADALALEHDLGEFDVCLLNNVIYYFDQEERLQLLHRVKTLLRSKAQVGILCALRGNDYTLRMFRTHIPQNLMSFFLACHQGFQGLPTQDEIKTLLRNAGFNKIEVKPLLFNTSYCFFASKPD